MKPIPIIILLIFLMCSPCLLIAQDQVVKISADAEAEFDVAINPLDTNNIVVATMRGFNDVANSFLTIYFTRDFGETWEVSDFRGRHNGEPGSGDPVLSFDADGNLYLVSLIINDDFEVLTSISVSRDGGENWSLFTIYDEITDKPWLEIDRSDESPFQGNIYVPVVEEELVLLTFSSSGALLNRSVIEDGEQLPSVVVGKNGDIFTSNISLRDPMDLYFQHFTNEGRDLISQRSVAQFPDYTFNADDVSRRFQPSPYLAIDNTDGPFSGRIYLTYTASEASGDAFFDVFLIYSDDEGLSWSEPKIVHTDDRDNVQHFYSSIYVNEDGVLVLDWYDRSDFDPMDSDTDFVMGISKDGGVSFQEIKLNSESMDFAIVANAGFGFGIGEYHQCVATAHTAVSFWSDGRTNDGDLNIYFSKVGIEGAISSLNEIGRINRSLSISPVYPQPSSGLLYVDLELKKDYQLGYAIYSLDGQVISLKSEKPFSEGAYTLEINEDLASGTYFLLIQSEGKPLRTSKFIIQK